jgi:hypothetical protein
MWRGAEVTLVLTMEEATCPQVSLESRSYLLITIRERLVWLAICPTLSLTYESQIYLAI